MEPGAGNHSEPIYRPSLAHFIRSNREAILRDWERTIRRVPIARRLDHDALLDHLPILIDHITRMIEDSEEGHDVRPISEDADIHAIDRLEEGYELETVVEEFAVLRECILSRWHIEGGGATGGPTLNRAIDQAVAASVSKFIGARDRTLIALDRISAAALEHTDVDAFLQSLSMVLISTTPAIDSVSLFLREGDSLRMRAVSGLAECLPKGLTIPLGEKIPGLLATGRKPLEIKDVATNPLVQETFRDTGARVIYGMPMLHGGEVIGSAQIASRSAYEFSHEDKILFRTMVERATLLVVQAQLVVREKAARKEAERIGQEFRTLAESMPILVWIAGPDGALNYGNSVLAEYIGAPSSAIYGDGGERFIHADDLPKLRAQWASAVQTGEPLEAEYRIRRADGVFQWFLIRARALRDEQGAVVKWFGTGTNVDVLKNAEAEALQRVRFSQQLVGIVSHDLRNPVAAIILGVQAMLRNESLDERTLKGLTRVHSAADRVARMIRDLLDFTQAKLRGGIPIQRQPLNFHHLVQHTIDEVQAATPERCIKVSRSGDGNGNWDADRIAQVITNLVTNALRYSPPDSCVDVSAEGREGDVVLSVHNAGEPIPAELLERIFEPMERGVQTDAASRNIGLGLYIVSQIVRAHGGRVEVRSSAEEGTTFTVTLPRA